MMVRRDPSFKVRDTIFVDRPQLAANASGADDEMESHRCNHPLFLASGQYEKLRFQVHTGNVGKQLPASSFNFLHSHQLGPRVLTPNRKVCRQCNHYTRNHSSQNAVVHVKTMTVDDAIVPEEYSVSCIGHHADTWKSRAYVTRAYGYGPLREWI